MFEDYESEVLKDYHEKRDKGQLAVNLMHPTPGNLRDECVAVFDRGLQKKDEILVKSFFKLKDDPETHRTAIKKWDRDRFRTLNLVLNRGEIKTAQQNIELLAWLTGFETRPYALWLKRGSAGKKTEEIIEEEGISGTGEDDPEEGPPRPPVVQEGVENKARSFFSGAWVRTVLIVSVVLTATVCIVAFWPPPPGSQKCMFWNGDQYEPIACDRKPADTTVTVIGLDPKRMVQFRRITRPDTLTAYSIGRVWYIRTGNGLEYYTAPGEYPPDNKRRVLPLTAHILDVYPRKPG